MDLILKEKRILKKGKIIKLAFFGLFIFIILLAIVLIFNINLASKTASIINPIFNFKKQNNAAQPIVYAEYKNEDYNFAIKYPELLTQHDMGQNVEYLEFIRLEENNFSDSKGFAVGVRESTLEEEVLTIKAEFDAMGNAVLFEQKKTEVYGLPAIQLFYKPKDDSSLEERIVIVVARGKYAYSISTVPEKINEVLANFTFTD